MIQGQPFRLPSTLGSQPDKTFHGFFAPEKGRNGIAIEMQRQKLVREDVCFADIEVAVESSPVPA